VNGAELIEELAAFRLEPGLFDQESVLCEQMVIGGVRVPRLTNELWTARQRQGHSLHELSYRACFKAELPRFFLQRLTRPGDRVLDPFLGRGTTLLEAALLRRVPLGNDANPLSRILIEPRLDPPEPGEVDSRIDELAACIADPGPDPGEPGEPGEPDLEVFYHPATLVSVRALRRWFLAREADGRLDRADRWLRMVSTNRLTGHSPGFFSVRTMPPNQAVSIETQRKLNARLGLVPPQRDVLAILGNKSRSLLRDLTPGARAALSAVRDGAMLTVGDAADLASIADASVQCTVTSPPFLDVVDYAKDNWLRCWFNGLDANTIARCLTTSRRLDDWSRFVAGVFSELWRVTRPGGWIVFEVGEVRGGRVRLEEQVIPAATAAGFEAVGVVVHAQRFTKTANCWGVSNNNKGTNTNRLVLLQKPGRALRA
jgi:hypothetical protein